MTAPEDDASPPLGLGLHEQLDINMENDMSQFVPDPGTLFYADITRLHVRQIGSGDTAVAVKERDRSYSEKVFCCVAVDDHAVVADCVWGHNYGDARRMLVRSECTFRPLGPGIAQALGLDV